MEDLQGKVVIVTGASSGIGRSAALLLASFGANVIANARSKEKLDSLCEEAAKSDGTIVRVAGDVNDQELHHELVHAAVQRFGRLDGAFNNAGDMGPSTLLEHTVLSDWSSTIGTNLTSAFLAAQAQIPQLRASGGGSIVFTGSFVGWTAGLHGMAAYAASKAGLLGLVKVLAVECAETNIRVNAIVSGGVDTPMGQRATPTPEARGFVENLHAMKRIADPQEVANPAVFLLSNRSSFMTGTSMAVDGGVSINRS